MKKTGVLIFLILALLITPVYAQQEGVDKAYTCLEDEIANKTSETISLESAVFSTLALGSRTKLTEKIESERTNQDCWPKASCTVKDTAQVLLAYDSISKDTKDIINYLYTQNGSSTELTWYLQIDISNHIPASCTISYNTENHDIEIGEDMKILSGAGSCLTLSQSGYWLQVSRSCFDTNFQVSCNEDFITSLLYQKSGSQTIYVSSETHSQASSGTTEEKVTSECFKAGSSCDYEGTLWAALALQKSGEKVSSYLPYLLAFAEDNQRLFPSSFLYSLTSGDDQYNEVVQSQHSSGFWEAPNTKYNKFYDTSLALLSLQSSSAAESDTAKTYLLSIQTPKGCWNNNNIRDTAFILYSGWPKQSSAPGNGGGEPTCAEAGFYCGSEYACAESQGQVYSEYSCQGLQKCCSIPLIEQTCAEKNGVLCSFSEQCSGTEVSSAEGSCCLAVCQPKVSETTECQEFGGFCSSSCESGETESSYSCNEQGVVCCLPEQSSSGGSLWIWIILLIILIIILALAIIFRHKLQLWWFKLRNKGNGSNSQPSQPRSPPRFPPASQPPIQRPNLIKRQPVRRAPSKMDNDMEETLKKLREMSR